MATKKTPAKRGRPATGTVLKSFTVRLTEEEQEEYKAVAEDLALNISSWIRMTLKNAAREHRNKHKRPE